MQDFGVGAGANMILNTMVWSRREVVALPDKRAISDVGSNTQLDADGNCLGIVLFLPAY